MVNSEQAGCFYLDIADLPQMAEIEAQMPPQRRQAMRAFVRHADKMRCMAGWLLLRTVLGPRAEQIRFGRYGKPFLHGGPYFSISHSGRYVILAIAPMPVGADVEVWRQGEDYLALAAHALHPDEQAFLRAHPVAQTFYDLWTLKESWLKLRGRGLGEAPESFAVSMDCAEPRICSQPDFYFRIYRQLSGHSAAVCLYRCQPPPDIVALQL